mmetsp:Transcript_45206/g.107140  ORF Transcript_45206/g.107140 Transcript_45206/m.107140 type:complete len:344 (+) Transcript_45206:105-1136(+)
MSCKNFSIGLLALIAAIELLGSQAAQTPMFVSLPRAKLPAATRTSVSVPATLSLRGMGADWYSIVSSANYALPIDISTVKEAMEARASKKELAAAEPEGKWGRGRGAVSWLKESISRDFPDVGLLQVDDGNLDVNFVMLCACSESIEYECEGPYEIMHENRWTGLRRMAIPHNKAFDTLLIEAAASVGIAPTYMPGLWLVCSNDDPITWLLQPNQTSQWPKSSHPALTDKELLDGVFNVAGEKVRFNRATVAAHNKVVRKMFFGKTATPPGVEVTLPDQQLLSARGVRACLAYIVAGELGELDGEIASAAEYFGEDGLRSMCEVDASAEPEWTYLPEEGVKDS